MISEGMGTVIAAAIAGAVSLGAAWYAQRTAAMVREQRAAGESLAAQFGGYENLLRAYRTDSDELRRRIGILEADNAVLRQSGLECEGRCDTLRRRVNHLERRLGLEGPDGMKE